MKHEDVNELEIPREAPTNPAVPLTERQMLQDIRATVADLAAAVRRIELNTKGAIAQAQSVNKRMSELEQRVDRIERGSMNGETEHTGEAT